MQFSAVVWACWKAPLFNMSIRRAELCIARIKHVLYLGCFVTAVQGWGGIRGGTGGAQCTANGKRQRVGGALRYHGPWIFNSVSAVEQGGTLGGGALPPALSFLGCKATRVPLSIPSPLVTRGRVLKKAVKSTAYLFPASFISYRFNIILI